MCSPNSGCRRSEIKIHPTHPDWVLARVRRNECLKVSLQCMIMQIMIFHARQQQHLLGSCTRLLPMFTDCWPVHLQDDSAISKWCAFDLFLSQDFARSWKNLTADSHGVIASFWDFEWGASLKRRKVLLPAAAPVRHFAYWLLRRVHISLPLMPQLHVHASFNRVCTCLISHVSRLATSLTSAREHMQMDPFPDQTILATVYESTAKMKGPYPGWDKDMHFVVSSDFFKSKPRSIVPCGNQFEVRVASQRVVTAVYLPLPSRAALCLRQPV